MSEDIWKKIRENVNDNDQPYETDRNMQLSIIEIILRLHKKLL